MSVSFRLWSCVVAGGIWCLVDCGAWVCMVSGRVCLLWEFDCVSAGLWFVVCLGVWHMSLLVGGVL